MDWSLKIKSYESHDETRRPGCFQDGIFFQGAMYIYKYIYIYVNIWIYIYVNI